MKLEKMLGERFKERPSDCVIDSHALMIRGGYMKFVTNGVYSYFMPLERITKKVEAILREEMDAIDGQEVKFPVIMPASLWEESGRYTSIASELMRLTDRNGTPMVLGLTHEEAAVQIARDCAGSYTKYPFMIYQIQTKLRDEARPRAGLIRTREFTMKDAYSFHTSHEDLERYYNECYKAYERIFARAGLPEITVVASDSGVMGGKIAHEFMFVTPVGEDSLVLCPCCGKNMNMEAAESIVEIFEASDTPTELVYTPGKNTIDEVCTFLGTDERQSCKAVVYAREDNDEIFIVFIRGDLEVNETKIRNHIHSNFYPAAITPETGIVPGFIGPIGENKPTVKMLFDSSLRGAKSLACGANKEDYHYKGFCPDRDVEGIEYFDFAKVVEGGICPSCHEKSLNIVRGIELGNIFQLGTKYTESMNMQYLDSEGKLHYPIMGSYGIGVERLIASVCENSNDDKGPIWPISIAPWQVHLCCVRADDEEVKEYADSLYEDMKKAGIEVVYDDRDVSAGVMFSDADLLGVPVRVVVSPRNMKESVCEISTRNKSYNQKVPLEGTIDAVSSLIQKLYDEINEKVN